VKKHHPRARVIENSENAGFARANNQGIEASTGEFVLTLNNDTELGEGFFTELQAALDASPDDVGMWAPKILSMEKRYEIDSVGGLLVYPDGLAKGRGRLERDRGQFDGDTDAFIPSACAGVYRRAMLEEVGGFDEDFFAYCEDTDLGLRARLAGWKAASVPRAVVYHHYSATGGRYTPTKAFLVERNHLWVAIKNLPARYLLLLPLYTSWRYAVQVYGIVAGRGAGGRFVEDFSAPRLAGVLVKAYLSAARGLPRMLSRRRRLKRLRRVSAGEVKGWFRDYGLSAADLVLKD